MAKASTKKPDPTPPIGPPSNFRKRSAEGGAPWLRREAGTIITGVVQGRFARPSKPGEKEAYYYQIELSSEAEVVKTGGVVEVAEPGTLVNLDEIAGLKPLQTAFNEGEPNCWIRFVGKKKQNNDPSRTYWECEVYTGAEEIPV